MVYLKSRSIIVIGIYFKDVLTKKIRNTKITEDVVLLYARVGLMML